MRESLNMMLNEVALYDIQITTQNIKHHKTHVVDKMNSVNFYTLARSGGINFWLYSKIIIFTLCIVV